MEKDGKLYLETNIYEVMEQAGKGKLADEQGDSATEDPIRNNFTGRMIHTELLGKAFEPEQKYENPDGTLITFDSDYFGAHRGLEVLPGPFASAGGRYCLSR